MSDTAARLLALLSLLQSRPDWSGTELAARLGVTTRTIRNDIDRLRELDYPVDATRGAAGGYRLGAGGKLPPLLLDDEEAVAVAVGLRAATGIAGIEESSARALAKLEQVLPSRLRPTVAALATVVDRAPENTGTDAPDPEVDPAVLAAIAAAIRDVEWFRFDDRGTPRLVEPYRLLSWAATLVPRRTRPVAPASGASSAPTGSSRGCRPAAASPPRRCPAATTPRSRCARSRRAAGTCTRASASRPPPRPCSRASTRRSASSRPSSETHVGARHRRRQPRHDRRVHRHARHGLHGRVAARAAARCCARYSERYARAATA